MAQYPPPPQQQQQYGTVSNEPEKAGYAPAEQPMYPLGSPPPPHMAYQPDQIQPMQYQQQPPPTIIQPDRAMTQPPRNPPNMPSRDAPIAYEPKFVRQDTFHNHLLDCFGDFFACKNLNTCCCGMWCPCVLYSRIHYRLRAPNPSDDSDFNECNGRCWAYTCFGGSGSWHQRNELRHKYQLEGSGCNDWMHHCFCHACALCQEEKELLYKEKQVAEFVMHQNQYQPMHSMTMPLPPKQGF